MKSVKQHLWGQPETFLLAQALVRVKDRAGTQVANEVLWPVGDRVWDGIVARVESHISDRDRNPSHSDIDQWLSESEAI